METFGGGFERDVFQQGGNAFPHFLGGLVGERHCQHRGWRHVPRRDDVRDAVRDDPGLAAACTGQDQERSFGVGHGFALLCVQAFEKIHEWGTHSSVARSTRPRATARRQEPEGAYPGPEA